MSKKIYKEKYFPHDRHARQDPKIKKMLVHFRKFGEEKAQAAVCIYWWIVEDMHTDDYPISNIDAFADDYRCDVDFLKSILNDFDLFRIENDCFVSDRVLRNLKEQEEKSEKARKSIQARWKKNKNSPETQEDIQFTIDDETVNTIIQIFNKEFKKSQIVGKETREKIYKITQQNKISLDIWKKVFKNAKRGWNIKGENKKPSLKNILLNWDSFASDDYYLAPDENTNEKNNTAQKNEDKAAREIINESENLQIEMLLTNYDEFSRLNDSKRLNVIQFYKSNNNSVSKTIAYIKELEN